MRDKNDKPLKVGDWVTISVSLDYQETGKIIRYLDDGRIVVVTNKEYYGYPNECKRADSLCEN